MMFLRSKELLNARGKINGGQRFRVYWKPKDVTVSSVFGNFDAYELRRFNDYCRSTDSSLKFIKFMNNDPEI